MLIVKHVENIEVGGQDSILKNQLLLPFVCLYQEISENQDRSAAE